MAETPEPRPPPPDNIAQLLPTTLAPMALYAGKIPISKEVPDEESAPPGLFGHDLLIKVSLAGVNCFFR